MNIFSKAAGLFSRKSSIGLQSGNLTQLATLEDFSNILRFTKNYASLAKEGYIENVIANTCIRRTAEAMNSIPVKYMINGEEVDRTAGDKLVKSIVNAMEDPSVDYDRAFFYESVQSQLFIAGEAYVYLPENSIGNISAMNYLRPDKVTKNQSNRDTVHNYTYQSGDDRIVFSREATNDNGDIVPNPESLLGRFNMVILRCYNPLSEIEPLSRLTPAALSIDGHNEAMKHNNEVMKNAGKVSGILTFDNKDGGGGMKNEQIQDLYKKITERTTGSNKGKILIANNGAKFERFALTPQEMDFLAGIVQRSTDICNDLDYPPYLLGFTGATFSNQDAAKLSLYENSAIPKLNRINTAISTFISRKYDIDFTIELDLLNVPAMAPRFTEMNDNVIKQFEKNIITQNEAREKLHMDELPEGELFFGDFNRTPVQNEPPS